MLFHADLNFPGPKILTSYATHKFKPKLMTQKIQALTEAVEKFDI